MVDLHSVSETLNPALCLSILPSSWSQVTAPCGFWFMATCTERWIGFISIRQSILISPHHWYSLSLCLYLYPPLPICLSSFYFSYKSIYISLVTTVFWQSYWLWKLLSRFLSISYERYDGLILEIKLIKYNASLSSWYVF